MSHEADPEQRTHSPDTEETWHSAEAVIANIERRTRSRRIPLPPYYRRIPEGRPSFDSIRVTRIPGQKFYSDPALEETEQIDTEE